MILLLLLLLLLLTISKTNLQRRGNRPLVVPRHIIRQPPNRYRLHRVSAADDEEEREVLDAHGETFLAQEKTVTHGGYGETAHDEAVPVSKPVCGVCHC